MIMNKNDYMSKLDSVRSNLTNLKKLNKDPTEHVKRKLNGIIDKTSRQTNCSPLHKLVGHHTAGSPQKPNGP